MSKKGTAVGRIAELRDKVTKAIDFEEPKPEGEGPKGNPSSAGQNASKSKKDGNRKKRGIGRH